MKKKLLILLLIPLIVCLTGCKKDSETTTMTAYTSVYPIEYILESLYGNKAAIYGIYPDGVDYNSYKLTNKQLYDYSKGDLFVYNGTFEKEKNYAVKMINKNKKIKVIDASLGMSYSNNTAETWLNPANYLMMASNIKAGLVEYIGEHYSAKEIKKNYEKLKLKLSQLDAQLKTITSSSDVAPVIIVSNSAFKFLEKYGFSVISLQEDENLTDKILSDAKKLIANKTVSYIFLKDNEEESQTIKNLKANYPSLSTLRLNSLSTLSAVDRREKKDYISIMEENIDTLKLEVN
ncbi:MAG: metal ABC transporter substrate-binding protein [Bacilli bacterium]